MAPISTLDVVDDKWFLERSRVVAGKMERAAPDLARSLPDDTVDCDVHLEVAAGAVPFWKLTKPNLVGPSTQVGQVSDRSI